MSYYTIEGEEVSRQQIKEAVEKKLAVLHWSHGNWENVASLAIYPDAETAELEAERDTRGECWSMASEVWSHFPKDVSQACRAAAGMLTTS